MSRVVERLQEDDGDGFHLFVHQQLAHPLAHLVFVHGDDRGSEHVDALGHAAGQLARDQRFSVLAVLHVGDFTPLRTDKGLRTATLGDDVLEALGDD